MPVPTLPDLKAHLNIPTSDAGDDAELTGVLAAAQDVVEGIVGPLQGSAVTETHYAVASRTLVLRRAPVADLTAVVVHGSSTWAPAALTVTDVRLDPEVGVLSMASGRWFRGDVTVTYAAGRMDVPAAVSLAMLMIAKQMWDTQRGAQPLPLQGAADEQPTYQSFAPGIPERARVLLEPFARGPQVA